MHRPVIYLTLAIAMASGAAGCSIFKSKTEKDLDAALALWEVKGYSNYSMRFERACFCARPMEATLHVERGNVVAFEDVADFGGDPISDSLLVAWNVTEADFESVEGLFDIIAAAIKQDADDIDVTYHARIGYPQSISIDFWKNSIDDEIDYFASDVVESQ